MLKTSAQRKILRVLAEKNKKYTLNELSEMCHRSRATISRALKKANRYPFIKRENLPKSKKIAFSLNPDSRYTEAIRLFFEVERNRERQNGMVPVDVWNLLEDVTGLMSQKIDGFIELFLFGSYATGDYHAESDIDLLFVHTPQNYMMKKVDSVLEKIGDKRIQVISAEIEKDELKQKNRQELMDKIKFKSPIRDVDVLIPLAGELR